MLNRDDPKAKEDGSSSVGGEDMSMAMITLSEETIEKSVAPGTDQSPRDEELREGSRRRRRKRGGRRRGRRKSEGSRRRRRE